MSVLAPKQTEAYRAKVYELYRDAEAWLRQLGVEGEIRRESITLDEELTGPYEIDSLQFRLPPRGTEVRLVPVGRYVIGALGGVDAMSFHRTERLVLLPLDVRAEELGTGPEVLKQCSWVWAVSREPWVDAEMTLDMFRRLLDVLG
jgi:hypothetical protein